MLQGLLKFVKRIYRNETAQEVFKKCNDPPEKPFNPPSTLLGSFMVFSIVFTAISLIIPMATYGWEAHGFKN